MSSLSERKLWQESQNYERDNTEDWYFYFDIEFNERELSLDDINQIKELKLQT